MIFHTAYKGGRPVCLSEETRAFAEESLRGKYGDETLKTPFVTMDDVAGFGEREDYDKYDEMIRRIAERAARAGDGTGEDLRRGDSRRGDRPSRARFLCGKTRFFRRQSSHLRL